MKFNLSNELIDISTKMQSAFIEASSFDVTFTNIDIDIKREVLIKEPFNIQNKINFLKTNLPRYADSLIYIKNPVVYFFTITEQLSNAEIVDLIKKLRYYKYTDAMGVASLPKILKNPIERDERVLYVGCKKKEFYKRICEHLGFCNPSTQGLNLFKWPNDLRKNIRLSYCELKDASPLSVSLIEEVLHKQLKPLIGEAPFYG